ncbi:PTS sugar transporter subunit IIA [bacterium]|nr:PTS sugar transporter subunit IIA [bacterium]
MERNPVMTTRELARYIKLNEKTVLRMAQNGQIPGVKIGNQWRFHLASIDRYLQTDLMESSNADLDLIISTKENVIPLSRLTDLPFMELTSPAKTSDDALAELSKIAYDSGLTPSDGKLVKLLKQRERMLSTAVCNGVAFPHPRHPSPELFKESRIIILRSEKGIDFKAPDGKLVRLFFMPCTPNEFDHVRLLAKISRLLHTPGMVDKIMNLETREQVMQLLLEFDREHFFINNKSL